eukprot:COSAG02_NODE_1221_length_13805_cov_24.976653_2_plen_992_part_00
MDEEGRLGALLKLPAASLAADGLSGAVRSELEGLGLAGRLGWLSEAQGRLTADSKANRDHARENKRCTAEVLAPPLTEAARAGTGEWGAALCAACTASPGACAPAALLDAVLTPLSEAERWAAVKPAFVDVMTKLRAATFISSEPKLTSVMRIACNLCSSAVAAGAYAAYAAGANEWVPAAVQIPVWQGGQGQTLPRGKALEETGILGTMFGQGCIPDVVRKLHTQEHGANPMAPFATGEVGEYFFPDPNSLARQRSQQAAESEVEMIGASLREVQQEQVRLIKAMLRKDTPTREPVLDWLCAAVEVNTTRGKEYMSHRFDSSDNFMLNLAYTLLRLTEPLTKDESKVASINPLYALSAKRYLAPPNREGKTNLSTYDDETKFALESDALDSWVDKRNLARIQAFDALRMARDAQAEVARAEEDGMEVEQLDKDELAMAIQMSLESDDGVESDAKGFNFATEAFFMTARALHHGLIPTLKVSVNRNVQHGAGTYTLIRQELSRVYQLSQAAQASGGAQGEQFERAMAHFGQLMACKHLFDAGMLETGLLSLAMSFYGLMARFLTRMATGHGADEVATVALPLPVPPPMEFAALPEHFAEDLCEFLLLVQELKPELLEQTSDAEIQCVLSLVVALLASPGYVRNPYLRCKFVAVLHSLLPKDEEDLQRQRSRTFAQDMSGQLLTNPICQHHLVRSLLQVYVDIENTGSHNQFHEKFQPREHIYGLLAHLCDTTALAGAGGAAGAPVTEGYPASLIAFLGTANYSGADNTAAKFISLLLNDTIFVFEDAMLKLKKIKELETEEDSWEALAEEEREAKKKEIEQERGICRYHLKQVDKTLHFLGYVTAHAAGVTPFVAPEMVDRMAGMVNAFVGQLVGSKASELKVAKKEALPEWQPRELLVKVLRLCTQLHAHAPDDTTAEKYVSAIVSDGRYSAQVYRKASTVLVKLVGAGDPVLAGFTAFTATHEAASAAEIDLDAEVSLIAVSAAHLECP